jgi:hypothetical protein
MKLPLKPNFSALAAVCLIGQALLSVWSGLNLKVLNCSVVPQFEKFLVVSQFGVRQGRQNFGDRSVLFGT